MKKIFLSLVVLFSVFVLSGCGNSNKLIGTWNGKTEDGMKTTWIFEKKDKVSYKNEFGIESTGTYTIKDDVVTITLEVWNDAIDYKYDIKDKKLNLTAQNKYSPSYVGLEKVK